MMFQMQVVLRGGKHALEAIVVGCDKPLEHRGSAARAPAPYNRPSLTATGRD